MNNLHLQILESVKKRENEKSIRDEIIRIKREFEVELNRKDKNLNRLDYLEHILIVKKNQILEISIKENYVMSEDFGNE